MIRLALSRLAWMVVLLLAISAVTFGIFFVLPGADPAVLRGGQTASPELIEQIRATLGLDRPLHVQYVEYVKDVVLHFDFGYSYQNDAPVRDQILSRLPATISLAVGAVVVWLAVGLRSGSSALRRGSAWDRVAMSATLLAISAPGYWLGLVALYLLSNDIGLLPLFPGAGSYVHPTEDLAGWAGSLILPWFILATGFSAVYARLMRASLSEVMSADYIRTARAKGVRERDVVLRHGVRAAITPIVTVLGLDLGLLLGGAILVESVFNIPGVGRLSYEAIQRSDVAVIQGTVLFAAFFVVVANAVVDLLYAWLDPRVRRA